VKGPRINVEPTELIPTAAKRTAKDECANLVIGQLQPERRVGQRETIRAHLSAL